MSRLTAARRIALGALALLVVVALVLGVIGVSMVRRSFPQTSGEIKIPGLTSKVSVLRDDRGVPQIYADNTADLFRAEGFVHAQDRFFEMDMRRHVTAGRLSELVGSAGVDTDKVIRTLGWRHIAEQELPTLKPETRQILQAYADGVNAYIDRASTPSRMGLEYVVLGQKVPNYRVEEWTPADSLAWLRAMAWDLKGDYTNELTRATLFGRVSESQINDLYPDYPELTNKPILSPDDWTARRPAASAIPGATPATSSAPVLGAALTSASARKAMADTATGLAAIPALLGQGEGIGSNSWVVGSAKSTTGKPLLANDPHLDPSIPGIWYQVGLHCRSLSSTCPVDVSGFSFSGLPGIVIGHNANIAWGFTNLEPDTSDFYLQQVRGDTYLRDGHYVPLQSHQETIKVAGEADQTITVRTTVQGPVVSDVVTDIDRAGHAAPVDKHGDTGANAVSLAWTGLRVTKTADAILGFSTATNFRQFREAAKYFAVPAQNLVYADTAGNIGYQASGMVPIRRTAVPGSPPGFWPAPGWVSTYDWHGFVQFDQLPYAYNPPEGFLVAANQALTSSSSGGPFLTSEWDNGYRAQRIRNLLEGQGKISPDTMSSIQGDTRNQFAPQLVRALLHIDLSKDPFTQEAQQLLKGWDFSNPAGRSRDGAAAAYYNAVWRNLLRLGFDDELPPSLEADGGDQWMRVVSALLLDARARAPWWDNKQTPGLVEGRDEILRQALVEGRLELTRFLGKDPEKWQWGKLHQLTLKHKALGGSGVPGIVNTLFNRGPYEMPGGSALVDANGWSASEGYFVDHAPSMRMVVDLGNLDDSKWVNQTGQSGHPFSSHYDDQTDAWIHNKLFEWPFTEKAVKDSTDDELTLAPGDQN